MVRPVVLPDGVIGGAAGGISGAAGWYRGCCRMVLPDGVFGGAAGGIGWCIGGAAVGAAGI